jgi:ferric-dicitrate binding protein FerR (iron transport regulator)
MTEKPYSKEMLEELGEKWINGTITPEEKALLFEWYDQFDDTELSLDAGQTALFRRLKEEMLRDIRQRIKPPARIRPLTRRVAVAAAVLLLLASGAWFFTSHNKPVNPVTAAVTPKPAQLPTDIGPGSNKAVLTLGDGSTVVLDSSTNGSLGRQGNARVIKNGDGQLRYAAAGDGLAKSIVYNVLSTPKGGQYRLSLQDGTNVWLNAGSSIRYPTAFTGKERRVEITGEAYFEIAKNADMPFHVSVTGENPADIEVLGTEFDVNDYKDEPDMKTTLLGGSIRLSSVTLKPSQQAVISAGKAIKTVTLDNAEQTIAWKNGAFEFDDADIPAIMRQISRWYDVEVEYEGSRPADHFTGRFSRNTSLAGVLQILNISGVRFAAENKKIIIKS